MPSARGQKGGRFSGQRLDETGLYFYDARYYDTDGKKAAAL